MGVRTRGLNIKAGAAKLKTDRAARQEAELVVDRWNRLLLPGATCFGLPRSAPRRSLEFFGSMCSAPDAGQAERSICGRSIVTRWHRWALACSACVVLGAPGPRQCQSCWACTQFRRWVSQLQPSRDEPQMSDDEMSDDETKGAPIRVQSLSNAQLLQILQHQDDEELMQLIEEELERRKKEGGSQ
jgi:hypothetical protein